MNISACQHDEVRGMTVIGSTPERPWRLSNASWACDAAVFNNQALYASAAGTLVFKLAYQNLPRPPMTIEAVSTQWR
jgi:hypothetical protein